MIPRKPSKGDPIDLTTRSRSSIIDAVEDLRGRQSAQYPGDQWRDTIPRGTVIKCLNHSSEVIPQYGAVELDGPRNGPDPTGTSVQHERMEDLFKSQIYFACKLPTTWTFQYPNTEQNRVVGIAQHPINIDEVGDVLIDGVTQARITQIDQSYHRWAKPRNNSTDLMATVNYGPIEILWRPLNSPTGTAWADWCLVRLSMTPQVLFLSAKAQEDWRETGAAYPSGDPVVDCKSCDTDGNNVTGDTFTVHLPRDRIGNVAGADPSVYENDVIKYMYAVNHTWGVGDPWAQYCISEYLHMGKITDIRIQGVNDKIPTGWQECDGASKTGEAGTFNLHDFATTYAPVGTVEDIARMPRHKSPNEVQAEINEVWFLDAIGEAVGASPIKIPTPGNAIDSAGDHFNVQVGRYQTCTIMYIQRWK